MLPAYLCGLPYVYVRRETQSSFLFNEHFVILSPSQPLLWSVPNSLPTNGCSLEQHIPFPHLTNKSKPSKIWKVDLHLGMSCLGILMAKYMELAFKKVCDLRLNV